VQGTYGLTLRAEGTPGWSRGNNLELAAHCKFGPVRDVGTVRQPGRSFVTHAVRGRAEQGIRRTFRKLERVMHSSLMLK